MLTAGKNIDRVPLTNLNRPHAEAHKEASQDLAVPAAHLSNDYLFFFRAAGGH